MANKKTRPDVTPSRKERAAAELRAREANERTRARVIWGAIAFVVLFLVGFAGYGIKENQDKAKITGLDAVKTFKVEAAHVTADVKYPQNPPAGGPHNPVWLNCGNYDKAVPDENAVHSMEHGAVWITYRPDLAAADVQKLKDVMPPSYGVLSPREELPSPIVASAWGTQLQLDSADDPRVAKFISAYSQSSSAPEPGASCTGGSDGTLPLDAAERM